MSSRRLSQLAAIGLAALTWWWLITRPEVLDGEFVVEFIGLLGLFTLILFGVMFLALRWATGGSATYWTTGAPDQVPPIGWMIVFMSAGIVGGYMVLAALEATEPLWLEVNYLLVALLVPVAFLLSKKIRLPTRVAKAGGIATVVSSVAALALAAAYTWNIATFRTTEALLPRWRLFFSRFLPRLPGPPWRNLCSGFCC